MLWYRNRLGFFKKGDINWDQFMLYKGEKMSDHKRIKCAVVGVGYLGKFHADKYAALDEAELVAVCDSDTLSSQKIAEKHNVLALQNYPELIGKVDAVSIAVPTSLHYQVTKFFLENNVHVLLEKPITVDISEADELIDIANKKHLIFQIGHLERFNPVFIETKPLLHKPVFIETVRLAPFKTRGADVNVVLDLMIHDLDLVKNIVASDVKKIDACGANVLSKGLDVANARIEFTNGCIASLTASRVSPSPERKMYIYQQDATFSCDFHNKNLIVSKPNQTKPEMIDQTIKLESNDALADEIASFVHSIQNDSEPKVTAKDARDALAIAVEITRIVESHSFL